MRQTLFWILVWFSPFCFAGGHVIGNGGDGLILGHRLYLRDLIEAGVEKKPYFGEEIDPVIYERINLITWNQEVLPFDKELLLRKLSDLERISPNLGHYVLDAIIHYTWNSVTPPLETVPDPGQVLKTVSQDQKQIANRLDSTIRIHRQSWLGLDDANRVALILHEAIYSLLKPICSSINEDCYQSARQARRITGLIFMESSFDRPPSIESYILPFLDVPDQWIDLAPFAVRYWGISYISTGAPIADFVLNTEIPVYNDHFMNMVEESCKTFERYAYKYSGTGRFVVTSVISLLPYEVDFVDYKTPVSTQNGVMTGRQTRLVIRLRNTELERKIKYEFLKSKESCTDTLYKHFQIAIKGE